MQVLDQAGQICLNHLRQRGHHMVVGTERMPMNEKDRALDAWLVANARLGDKRAMAQLVELRGPRLIAHATRLLGEHDGASDVAQEAWVDILRGLRGLRDGRVFLPWALRIVSRKVAREIRREHRGRRLDAAVEAKKSPAS